MRVLADFNGLFDDILCLSHSGTVRDDEGNDVVLAVGMKITAIESDPDVDGTPGFLVASGLVEQAPEELACRGSRWVLHLDPRGVRHCQSVPPGDDSCAPETPSLWKPYDPTWLVDIARTQQPELVAALSRCTNARIESHAYIHFVEPASPNRPEAEWKFDRNVILQHPEHGEVVLDLLQDGRVGGIEFLDRL